MQPDDKTLKDYERMGIDAPASISHGLTDGEISSRMERAEMSNWRLMGNQLVCDTQFGPLTHHIDPGYILRGIDDNGLPILVKLDI